VSKARATLEQARHKNPGSEQLWLAAVRTEQRAALPKAADSLMAKALQVRRRSPALLILYCRQQRCSCIVLEACSVSCDSLC